MYDDSKGKCKMPSSRIKNVMPHRSLGPKVNHKPAPKLQKKGRK